MLMAVVPAWGKRFHMKNRDEKKVTEGNIKL